ncbi:N-6 DNA methylase, partial [Candidatus Aminicenantes bacterium AC-708-M15]|nr:N-6 DNA methylase [Candidatus Aminicenantes bacterium AC-708-M15]
LYFPQCIYKFDVIDVDLLGSIYERYLGKTIKVTPKRVKVEEKPEVRKAGGVYYTPKYIVDYIVKNTVGKIIQGKTPEQISKIKILDPACGSGSFLISAFQTLIDYHLHYYEKHPEESGQGTLFPDVIEDYDGTKRLSIEKKAQILRNNIFGVDIDPQAVEITMMSLYLKCLEGEKDLPRKKELLPSLAKNIRCGNSLISFDIFDQPTLFKDEEKERINPFDWYSKSTGFGDIMEQGGFDVVIGNPPYIRIHSLPKVDINYYRSHYVAADKQFDIFCIMIEKGISLLKQKGRLGFIVPSLFLKGYQYSTLRKLILEKTNIESLTDFGDGVFENVKMPTCVVIFQKIRRPNDKNKLIFKIKLPNEKGFIKKIVPQIIYKTTESHTFEDIDEKTYSILLKIKKRAIDLESIMRITRGLEIGKKNKGISSQKIKGFIRVLSGEDIGRYEIRNVKFLDKNLLKKFWKDKEIFENPKIMIRETGVQITATYDDTGIYTLRTIYNMILKDHRFNLKYILGLLNSRLMQYFYTVKFKPVTDIFPKIRVVQTRKLPIRTIDFNNPKERAMHDKIVKLVDKMLELNKKKNSLPPSSERERIEREIKITDEKIDELVYELYGIIEEERKIIERGG